MRANDDRAVSEVIGIVLMFGLVVASLSIFQAQVVPTENKQVEIDHYEQAGGEMSQLKSEYLTAAGSTTIRSTTVTPGTKYPRRTLFVSGPSPRGRVQTTTVDNGTITASFNVSNACGTNSPVNTRNIVFDTDYNQFSDSQTPPYIFEHTVVHRQSSGTTFSETEQLLVESTGSGVTLNLFPLTSDFSRSGVESTAIEFGSVNANTRSVSADSNVTIPTTLSATQWNRLLSDEPVTAVVQNESRPNRVTLNISATDEVQVRCAPVATGFPTNATGANNGASGGQINWVEQSIGDQEGVEPPPEGNDVFTLDASTSASVSLEANSTKDTPIKYSATNADIVSFSRFSGTTNGTGKNSTVIRPIDDGKTTVFASNVPSSDSITFEIENTVFLHGMVFTNQSGSLFTLEDDRSRTAVASGATVIGPITSGVDGDSTTNIEIPFVVEPSTGKDQLKIATEDETRELEEIDAPSTASLLAVGKFNRSEKSVFYANSSGAILRTTGSGPTLIKFAENNKASAVLGIGDIDSDNRDELVFVNTNNLIKYVEEDGKEIKGINPNIGVGANRGGAPADFDGDGNETVPIVDSSGNIKLLNADGEVKRISSNRISPRKVAVATTDVDRDGIPEIVYVNSNSAKLKYIDRVRSETPTSEFVREADGSKITVIPDGNKNRGVA